jgi:hypothetical protein
VRPVIFLHEGWWDPVSKALNGILEWSLLPHRNTGLFLLGENILLPLSSKGSQLPSSKEITCSGSHKPKAEILRLEVPGTKCKVLIPVSHPQILCFSGLSVALVLGFVKDSQVSDSSVQLNLNTYWPRKGELNLLGCVFLTAAIEG